MLFLKAAMLVCISGANEIKTLKKKNNVVYCV